MIDRYFDFEDDNFRGVDKVFHLLLAVAVYWITGSFAWTLFSETAVEVLQSVSVIEIKAEDPWWKVILKRTLGHAKPSWRDIAMALPGAFIVWVLKAFF